MRYTFLLLFLISFNFLNAQQTINQTDKNGLKQGRWESKYPDGKKRYEGSFADGKPVGEWTRYHENGKIKAKLFHVPQSEKVKASLYDDEGILYAKGNYQGIVKDSVWNYYNNNTIVGNEYFVKGKREGKSLSFYADGTIAKEVNYKSDLLQGPWREFYPSGSKKAEMVYNNGIRDGWCIIYYENGQTQIEGKYLNDREDGPWSFFAEDGKLKFKLEYQKGNLLNPEVADSLQLKEFSEFDKNRGKFKDPAFFRNNPDELMKR
jgi:antitoxin component YwqK of YwqJK toxin-antitoxin module